MLDRLQQILASQLIYIHLLSCKIQISFVIVMSGICISQVGSGSIDIDPSQWSSDQVSISGWTPRPELFGKLVAKHSEVCFIKSILLLHVIASAIEMCGFCFFILFIDTASCSD